jgi:glycosyltransferase involved in cell wall biosynthesis
MSDPLVSIIMPVYNGEQYLSKAIESVLLQTYQNFELIIVNDGSTDNSKAVIESYLKDLRIRYFEQCNAGVAAARNAGIAISQGELIALLDQDDIWLPHKLLLQIQFMTNNPEIGLVHTAIQCINGSGELMSCKNMIWVGEYEGICTTKLLSGNGIAPLTVLARFNLLKQCGGFIQKRAPADDWDLWLRMSRLAPLGFLSDVCAQYRIHDCNESRNLLKMKRAEIAVLEDYLVDFKHSMTALEMYIVELKIVEFCRRAAFIAKDQDYLEEATEYTAKAHKITHNSYSFWHFRDRLVVLLLRALSKSRNRLAWYRVRLMNLK